MNPFFSIIVRTFVAIPVTAIVWLFSFFAFDQPFFLASAFGIGGGIVVWWILSVITKVRFLKKNRLTGKEYRYIKKNLDEAKKKIKRLNKTLFSLRHLSSLKVRIDLLRMVKKIYSMTKKEPKRFYEAEPFYFSHLDSVLELTEKYVFLSSQPKKNREIDQSLYETRQLLEELTRTVENDLYQVVSADVEHLNFEIDVAKRTIKTQKDSKFIDHNRRLK